MSVFMLNFILLISQLFAEEDAEQMTQEKSYRKQGSIRGGGKRRRKTLLVMSWTTMLFSLKYTSLRNDINLRFQLHVTAPSLVHEKPLTVFPVTEGMEIMMIARHIS
ncbi:unnamed protein product [Natator depressus]